jgi:hypothetical protein
VKVRVEKLSNLQNRDRPSGGLRWAHKKSFQRIQARPKRKESKNSCYLWMNRGYRVSFFDRYSQYHTPWYGVRGMLYFNPIHFWFVRYASGRWTNKRVDFIALWTMLEIVNKKGIYKLQIMGNSKLVIN